MKVRVAGVVQGVGFRPFVHRLALELGITGTVGNDSAGVLIHAHGSADSLASFLRRLRDDAPPLAVVQSVTVLDDEHTRAAEGPNDVFRIIGSDPSTTAAITALPADVAVCDDCLAEIRDPHDRRHRYPFITCTNCGPRFTITRRLPYDRPNTTMAVFALCAACQAEYDDPGDRRHHAQPLACPECGPRLALLDRAGVVAATADGTLRGAQRLIDAGSIVAVKGVGGYHLVCDATNPEAVARFRERKRRGDKPFAVLLADAALVEAYATVGDDERAALTSPQRPIVLLRRHRTDGVAGDWPESVAPGAADVGVMLPCSPVQHLLLDGLRTRVVVSTSGNLADEPIAIDDADARSRLAGVADAWLSNDRPIHSACDDSIVRVSAGRVLPVRRARGFTPLPIQLPANGATVLAMGGDLKGALCLVAGDQAFMSQHLGDHGQLATHRAARQAALQLVELLQAAPEAVAIDAHPGYFSSRLGRELAAEWGVPVVEVQHHHAHVVAAMTEQGEFRPVIGVACDGTGYSPDGTIWGSELLLADAAGFERVGTLRTIPLPGGDAAAEHPARTALAHLWAAGVPWDPRLWSVAAVPEDERRVLLAQFERGVHTVPTSSAGRLFDAVASLAGVRQLVDYEAQAAIELEAILDPTESGTYTFPPARVSGAVGTVDCAPVIRAIVADVLAGAPPSIVSARFHSAFVSHVHHEVRRVRARHECRTVALTGGVFQNAVLAERCQAALVNDGCTVLTHRVVPTNDGGLALGQAMIGRASINRASINRRGG